MAIVLDNKALVTIYGGTGFIGRHLVGAIAKTGARMRAPVFAMAPTRWRPIKPEPP